MFFSICPACGMGFPKASCQVCGGAAFVMDEPYNQEKEDDIVITDHHDGHGLADSIQISHDDRDPLAGGASHHYICMMPNVEDVPLKVADIEFQHGARFESRSTTGIVDSALLAIVLDRLRCFQAGPFSSRQNAIAITKIEEALMWMRNRADERLRRGVLGKNEK